MFCICMEMHSGILKYDVVNIMQKLIWLKYQVQHDVPYLILIQGRIWGMCVRFLIIFNSQSILHSRVVKQSLLHNAWSSYLKISWY